MIISLYGHLCCESRAIDGSLSKMSLECVRIKHLVLHVLPGIPVSALRADLTIFCRSPSNIKRDDACREHPVTFVCDLINFDLC